MNMQSHMKVNAHLFIYLIIYLFIYLFIHSFIHLFIFCEYLNMIFLSNKHLRVYDK